MYLIFYVLKGDYNLSAGNPEPYRASLTADGADPPLVLHSSSRPFGKVSFQMEPTWRLRRTWLKDPLSGSRDI